MGWVIVLGLSLFAVSLSMLSGLDTEIETALEELAPDSDGTKTAQSEENDVAQVLQGAAQVAEREVPAPVDPEITADDMTAEQASYQVDLFPMPAHDLSDHYTDGEDDPLMARLEEFLEDFDSREVAKQGRVVVDIASPDTEELAQTVISDFTPGKDVLELAVDLDYPVDPMTEGDQMRPAFDLAEVDGDTVVRLAGYDLVVIQGVTDLPTDETLFDIKYAA